VEVRLGLRHLGELLAKLLDVGALLADDQARTCGVNGHAALLVRTLDDDLRDGSLLQLLLEILADLEILMEQRAVLAGVRVPAGVPGTVDAEAKADRIDFLTHYAASTSSTSRTTIVRCENGFSIRLARPRPRAWKRFMTIDLPTYASATMRESTSRSWLFSALAIADSSVFLTVPAMRLRENSRSARAVLTFLPRINAATRFSFCGLTRIVRRT